MDTITLLTIQIDTEMQSKLEKLLLYYNALAYCPEFRINSTQELIRQLVDDAYIDMKLDRPHW